MSHDATTPPFATPPFATPPFATEETYLHATDRGRDEAVVTLLCVEMAHERYGLPTASVREIIKLVDITEVPRLPSFVLGVISVRGEVIPVMDLRQRVGLGRSTPSRAMRIVIVQHGAQRFGLKVEGVAGLASFRASAIEPAPGIFGVTRGGAERYIGGLGRSVDEPTRIVMFLEIQPLLHLEEELDRHRKLRAQTESLT